MLSSCARRTVLVRFSPSACHTSFWGATEGRRLYETAEFRHQVRVTEREPRQPTLTRVHVLWRHAAVAFQPQARGRRRGNNICAKIGEPLILKHNTAILPLRKVVGAQICTAARHVLGEVERTG
jgi:hypothetical protein